MASEERVLTRSERMTRVIEAVLAQIKLKDTLFHIFMGLLKEVNLHLWDVINQYYCKCVELYSVSCSTKNCHFTCMFNVRIWMRTNHESALCSYEDWLHRRWKESW